MSELGEVYGFKVASTDATKTVRYRVNLESAPEMHSLHGYDSFTPTLLSVEFRQEPGAFLWRLWDVRAYYVANNTPIALNIYGQAFDQCPEWVREIVTWLMDNKLA